ncbi:hypothetical protein [Butyrivibrio sp. VCB2006]|uniref:hypothetical protein n=1 Tax=Butyrivibrio sp. VCB2006 TaxID=1280679 RepID=UPI000410FAB4|nr:hypothetical protein [Butyrivibrio sp. VCB2006]
MDFLTLENRKKIANRLFYLALLIELVLMIAEKSELYFDFESYVFRVTFVLTLLSVFVNDHSKKEWVVIVLTWIFTFICYRITGRNELLRFATFMMAAKSINLGKTMKASFWVSLVGFASIALLSVTGILGSIAVTTDYGRGDANELRYVFGFGHPNTLWGCVFALMLLWLWIYGSKARLWMFAILLAIVIGMYKITASRTAFLIGIITIVMALIIRYLPLLSSKKIIYIFTGLVTPAFCVAFSIWGACISYVSRYEFKHPYYKQIEFIDELLNNRIHNLYRANERHAGSIETWKLFSDKISEEYFDMGWVRLFYWYGIIPTAIICLLVIVFIYICYKRRDAWSIVLLLALSIYTVIEATFISVYIGRNIMLPIFGVYLCSISERMTKNNVFEG